MPNSSIPLSRHWMKPSCSPSYVCFVFVFEFVSFRSVSFRLCLLFLIGKHNTNRCHAYTCHNAAVSPHHTAPHHTAAKLSSLGFTMLFGRAEGFLAAQEKARKEEAGRTLVLFFVLFCFRPLNDACAGAPHLFNMTFSLLSDAKRIAEERARMDAEQRRKAEEEDKRRAAEAEAQAKREKEEVEAREKKEREEREVHRQSLRFFSSEISALI